MTINDIADNIKPPQSDAQATLCLNKLLAGETLNRNNLDLHGIGKKNDSLHSIISPLRNDRLIPIESVRTSSEQCSYFMKPEEIYRYKDPVLREQQRKEMSEIVENKSITKHIRNITRFRCLLRERPYLIARYPEILSIIMEFVREIELSLKDFSE